MESEERGKTVIHKHFMRGMAYYEKALPKAAGIYTGGKTIQNHAVHMHTQEHWLRCTITLLLHPLIYSHNVTSVDRSGAELRKGVSDSSMNI